MSLHVWSADDGEEFVIAETEEDALDVLAEMIGEVDGPIKWKQLQDEKAFTMSNEDGTTTTKTCAEWCAEFGRGHFCSVNY